MYKLGIAKQFDVQKTTRGHELIQPELDAGQEDLIEAPVFVNRDWEICKTSLKLECADAVHISFSL